MSRYRHIFFDLDRTLWDFERCSRETLGELYEQFALESHGVPLDEFITAYLSHNDRVWDEYSKDLLTKEQLRLDRFMRTLDTISLEKEGLAPKLAVEYTRRCPLKGHLIPSASEVLGTLAEKYRLHIITNGFEDVQHLKLKASGIESFFAEVVTSERAGYRKPQKEIFQFAVEACDAKMEECIMVGDHFEIDIVGAKAAGMDQVYFNPETVQVVTLPTYQVSSLEDLLRIF